MRKLFLGLLVAVMLVAACGPATEETPPAVLPTEAPPEAPTEAQVEGPVPTEVPTEPGAAVERTTVRFAITDWERPIYEDMITAFEEENPDLHVEIVSVNEVLGLGPIGQIEIPDDADQRLVAAADVVDIEVTRRVVQDNLVRDLTPLIEADPNFQPDDFYADALEGHQWGGGTWALPTTLNTRLVFYDKDVFDEAGVPYPEIGWTWDDLLVKAKALTVQEGDQVTRWGFVPIENAYRLVESRVGSLADYGADPPMPRFDDSEVVEAVRWYTDLYLKEQVMPYFEPQEEEEQLLPEEQGLIDKGQAAMWADSSILWWLRKEQGNIGLAPFPADTPDALANPVSVGHLAMSAGTTQPEAAWRWLEFLSRQTIGGLTLGMKFLPARRSAAETGGFWDDLDEELDTALRYAIDHSFLRREVVSYNAFDEALDAIFQGEKAVEDALADAQTSAEAEIKGDMAEQAAATPVPTFVVAASEKTPVPEGAVTITFVPGLGSLYLEPFRDLAEQFHEANPDVVVEVKMADFLTGAPDLQAMAEGSDCFQWFPGFQDAENREAVLGLAPFVDADPSFSSGDFYPQVLEQFTWQGQLMGLPADILPFIIDYNKDLFDAAGLDYPTPDWTWDDFLAVAVELTQGEDEEKQHGFVADIFESNDLILITERLGAKLVDASADPPKLSFNDPDTVAAVRWYAGLTTEHGVKPIFVTDLSQLLGATTMVFDREAMINGGRAAMWTSSPMAAMVFGERDLNAGTVPLPVRPDGANNASYLAASGYFVSAQTEHRQPCWQWITFLTQAPAAVQGLPARESVAGSDEYRQQVGAERVDAYLASVGDAEQPSAFQLLSDEEWLGGAIFWYLQAFGQIIEGEATVEDALDAAQKLADDYRACVIAGDDFGQEAWQTCVKEIDPTLPDFLFAGQ